MRNIKFRAWDKKSKEFVDDFIINPLGSYFQTNKCEFWGDDRDLVLLQYTGLNDKNGKEIYEGDIVRATFNDPFNYDNKKMPTETQTVIYSNGGFRLKEGPFNSYDGIGSFVMEVIGNIYENSELLEKKK